MFQRILLTTDFSEASRRLLDVTVRLAKVTEGEIFLMHVDEEEAMFGLHSSNELIHFFREVEMKRDDWMERLTEEVTAQDVPCTQIRAKGTASEQILRVIDEQHIDLAAAATVGIEGMKRILIGSTSKKVLRHAPCAVLSMNPMVRHADLGPGCKILYPFDFSDAARAGAATATELAQRLGGTLELLKVLKIPTLVPSLPGEPPITLPKESLQFIQADLEAELGQVVTELGGEGISYAVTIGSDEAESIADYAAAMGTGLIVIPRGGEGVLKRFFFGRVAHGVVKLATVPVLTLPVGASGA